MSGLVAMPDLYPFLKHIHQTCVILSVSGFLIRFGLMLRDSALLGHRWVRVVPHVNDTILLAAALALMVLTGQYPFLDDWLTAKIFGLIAYIVLGSVALKGGANKRVRMIAGVAALAVFGYVVTTALAKDARGALVLLR